MPPFHPMNSLGDTRGQPHDLVFPRRTSQAPNPSKRQPTADLRSSGAKRRKAEQEDEDDPIEDSSEDELSSLPIEPAEHVRRVARPASPRYGDLNFISRNGSMLSTSEAMVEGDIKRIKKTMNSKGYAKWSKHSELTIESSRKNKAATNEADIAIATKGLNISGLNKRPQEVASMHEAVAMPTDTRTSHANRHDSSPDPLNVQALPRLTRNQQKRTSFGLIPGSDSEDFKVTGTAPARPQHMNGVERSSQHKELKSRHGVKHQTQKIRAVKERNKDRQPDITCRIEYIAVGDFVAQNIHDMAIASTDIENVVKLFLLNGEEKSTDCIFELSNVSRVLYCKPGVNGSCLLRLEPRNVTPTENKMDIAFVSLKSLDLFITYLESGNPSIRKVEQEPDYMTKIFKRRTIARNEDQMRRSMPASPFLAQDIALIEAQKRRRDSEIMQQKPSADKPRKRPKVWEQLRDENGISQASTLSQIDANGSHSESKRHQSVDGGKRMPRAEQPKEAERVVDMEPAPRRPKRQTRSSFPTEIDDETLQPPIPRYSVVTGLGSPWKRPVEYPKEGAKRVTIEFEDLLRLDDGECLNDSLMMFHLRKVREDLERRDPASAKKIHWFNTYFFESLTKNTRGQDINYDAVKRWTKSIDLFSYDYVVIPVNEALHWYVAIICNLPMLGKSEGDPKQEVVGAVAQPTQKGDNMGTEDEPILNLQSVQSHAEANGDRESSGETTRQSLQGLHLNNEAPTESLETQIKDDLDDSLRKVLAGQHDPNTPQKTAFDLLPRSQANPIQAQQGVTERTSLLERTAEGDTIVPEDDVTRTTPRADARQADAKSVRRTSSKKKRSATPRLYNPAEPAIATLDSLGIAHPHTIRLLKNYLLQEAQDKRGSVHFEATQLKGITAKGIPIQDNLYDCGLYLLGYMDKFAEDPVAFVKSLLQREFDKDLHWPDLKPLQMRKALRDELFRLADEQGASRKKKKAFPTDEKAQATKSSQTTTASSPPKNTIISDQTPIIVGDNANDSFVTREAPASEHQFVARVEVPTRPPVQPRTRSLPRPLLEDTSPHEHALAEATVGTDEPDELLDSGYQLVGETKGTNSGTIASLPAIVLDSQESIVETDPGYHTIQLPDPPSTSLSSATTNDKQTTSGPISKPSRKARSVTPPRKEGNATQKSRTETSDMPKKQTHEVFPIEDD
jgi:Ulp1 family protease